MVENNLWGMMRQQKTRFAVIAPHITSSPHNLYI